ncbi:MAG TPA: hypothetical protein VGG25_27730 [Streptosporangiaceae bacterium]|jgi:hypothetical protein
MSWRKRAPVSVTERWRQAFDAGQAALDSFTQAELDCVAMDPDFLPDRQRGPALQTAAPLLARLTAERGGTGPVPAAAGPAASPAELAAAAAGLESRGYLRPGPPRRTEGTLADELAGWSADPAAPAAPTSTRRVAILGDLAIATRMRSQPYWVAEGFRSPQPSRPDPGASAWQLTGRMYAAYRPPGVLAEQPPGRDGKLGELAALWQPAAARLMSAWCGIDPGELADPARRSWSAGGGVASSAQAAAGFTSVTCVRVVHPAGQQVVIRSLITASDGEQHWLLEGEHAERAVPVSVDQIGERIDELVTPPGDAAAS